MQRRDFIGSSSLALLAGIGGFVKPSSARALENVLTGIQADPKELASDDAFWLRIRQSFITSPDLIDLDNANTSPTPLEVFNACVTRGQRLRHAPSVSFDKVWDEVDTIVRPQLAKYLGAKTGNVVFTPNATYGLNTVLHGFPLEKGDEILVTNHEYPDMIETILQRTKREGIVMRTVAVPPPSGNGLDLVESVTRAITPRTKLLLISHVSAWSGEVLPVKEVTKAAQSKGVAVLIDAAQSVGILDVGFSDIDADFLATSLHKWVEAPMGTGALLMKTEHVGKVWPLHPPSWDTTKHPLDLYEWSGTFNMAAYRSVSDALDFQRTLGRVRKRERIRFLGEYWQKKVSEFERVKLVTPSDRNRSFGVASIAVEGIPGDKVAIALRKKGVIVQDKSGRHSPFTNAVRVSPGIYTTTAELDRFVDALGALAQ